MKRIGPILGAIGALALLFARRPGRAHGQPSNRKPRPGPGLEQRRGRITTSTYDESGTVQESPHELLQQARERVADLTLDELTAARLIASEHSRGTPTEMAAIVDAELNRAESRQRTLTQHLTSRGTYGKQGGRHGQGKRRPASTRRDPSREHVRVARAVLGGELRGISRGAVRFFDPVSQWYAYRKWITGKSERRHCHPAVVLERWTHDLAWNRGGPPCALRSKPGKQLQAWIGPIDGINPLRLMLFRSAQAGDEHARRYREARRLILERYPLPNREE